MTAFTIPGPVGGEDWALGHHGRFRISTYGPGAGRVSLSLRASASALCWVRIEALWSRWDETDQAFEPVPAPAPDSEWIHAPVRVGSDGSDFLSVRTLYAEVKAPRRATHWLPTLHFHHTKPEVVGDDIPVGTKVRFDTIFVPDNGLPIYREPYLDGAQSFGVWEGAPHASTSIYGEKVPWIITADDDLLFTPEPVPEVDPPPTIFLEDEVTMSSTATIFLEDEVTMPSTAEPEGATQ